jgi:hypothetical protein
MSTHATNQPNPAPGTAEASLTAFSNAVRLTGRDWIVVGLFTLVLVLFGPSLWERVERFDPEPDYRIPYDLSADYWLYARYARLAAARQETLLVGDSVVWGEYVVPQQTLSHYLNEQGGKPRFANLGLDGTHPVVLAELVEHYGAGITGKKVVLQWNPLWLTSPRNDLQTEGDYPFNHPRLLPQFRPHIPLYKEQLSARIGIEVEKRVPFTSWTAHLQQAYFDRMDLPSWTLEHPYENPLKPIRQGLPPSDNRLRWSSDPWSKRGIQRQDFPWVDLATSLQWHAFQRTVEVLQSRRNQVFVVVGPFNEHLLLEKSRNEYHQIKGRVEAWLKEKGVAYAAPSPLPSELYADASHPLAEGYALLARQLLPRLTP